MDDTDVMAMELYDEEPSLLMNIDNWDEYLATLDLATQKDRLNTLYQWPHAKYYKTDLIKIVENGFYYAGFHGSIECHYCNIKIRWDRNTDVIREHRIYSGNCPIVVGKESIRNISLEAEDKPPAYLTYEKKSDRLSSFNGHNEIDNSVASSLADAGFFYTGHGRTIICFLCGMKGDYWSSDDDAWETHVKWNEFCLYVSRNKDVHEIARIKKRLQESNKNVNEGVEMRVIEFDEFCVLCQNKPLEKLFMPCQHRVVCSDCSGPLNVCPVKNCNEIIDNKIMVRIA